MNNSLPQHPSVFLLGHQRLYGLRQLRYQGLSLIQFIYIYILTPVLTAGMEPNSSLCREITVQSMGGEPPRRRRPVANNYVTRNYQAVSRQWLKWHQLSLELMNQVVKVVHAFILAENRRLLEPDNQQLWRAARLMEQPSQHLLSPFTQLRLAWNSGIVS